MDKGVRIEKERVRMERTKGDPTLESQGLCDLSNIALDLTNSLGLKILTALNP